MTRSAGAHVSDELLADVALGEQLPGPAQEHVATCAHCRLAVSELLEVIVLAQQGAADSDAGPATPPSPGSPPPNVWRAISAAIDDPSVIPLSRTGATQAARATGSAAEGTTGDLGDSPGRRRWGPVRGSLLLAAAVTGVLVGAGLVAAVDAWRTEPTVVASAGLTAVPGGPQGPQSGVAQVEKVSDGEVLAVSTSDLADPTGYYEVWLLDPAGGGMIAIGAVPGGSAATALPIPPGVDLSQYTAVDISDEPMDGNPGHSSVSVLRGKLST